MLKKQKKYYFDGDTKKATQIQLKSLKLTNALFSEVNPIPVKAACNMIGFDAGIPRLPLIEMSESGKENLKQEMINYGLKI